MSTPYFLLGTRGFERSARLRREANHRTRLLCRCGGTKTSDTMMVCLACFQAAPPAMQRDAYSRSPEVRRTAMRQLLARAESKKAEAQLSPGGELTTACVQPPRIQASPAAAGAPFNP